MSTPKISPEGLFDAFPEAAFLFSEGLVRYANPAARRLLPQLRAGKTLPEPLATLLAGVSGATVLAAQVDGRDWRISVQETEAGLLALLRPSPAESVHPQRLSLQLRQQTAALSAALQRLFPGGNLTPEKYHQCLSTANQGLYRLMRMADHLDFLALGAQGAFRPGALDLAGLCREVADGVEDLCRGGSYHFTYESELASLITEGDGELLRRMLLALLSNAMKAAGTGGRFGLRLTKLGGRAVLTVWDGGPGLEAGSLARLFSGEAEQPPALRADEGLGLGLQAVQHIAAVHGGTVMLEGREGEALRAIVSLPLRTPERGLPLRTPQTGYAGGQVSALLVEFSDLLPPHFYAPEDTE